MGLTPEENMAWHRIIAHPENQAFAAEMMGIVRAADTERQLGPDIPCDPYWDDKDEGPEGGCYYLLEVEVPRAAAEELYSSWWSFLAGDKSAWGDLEGTVEALFEQLGWELYGTFDGGDGDGD